MIGRILLAGAVVAVAFGFPFGPPDEACSNGRVPQHGEESLPKDTCPFMIVAFPWVPGQFVQGER